ncbi:MAG TPA: DUF1569 domain-containing protein [Gemmata sp.]|nr:DUF1569 domain-containing protein [Gemmata sp.]
MSDSKPQRRKLSFASLDDVAADAENLLAKGYDRAGNWDLAQVAGHIAEWMRFPIEGFPKPPLLIRPMLWLMKVTSGKKMLEKVLKEGFSPGGHTMPQTVPPPGGDAAMAVAKLKESVAKWRSHTGEVYPSPLFGPMTKETALQLQLKHAAHHLSFLVPRG